MVFGQSIKPSIPLCIFLITVRSQQQNKSWIYIGSILWYFQSFEVIDHKILLDKLNHYGIRSIANNWLQNYLANRQQYVQLENSKSSPKPIKCGVPQGSILGPLLYLIYVNDIENSCDSNILSFADDTTIYSSHSDKLSSKSSEYYFWRTIN